MEKAASPQKHIAALADIVAERAAEVEDLEAAFDRQYSDKSLGELVDHFHVLDALAKKYGGMEKPLKDEKSGLETVILRRMDAEQTVKAGGRGGNVSITEAVVPSVKDWDAFWAYVYRNKASHLLERRPAVLAYREELVARNDKPLPGVESYTRRTLRLS
ncbi:MAG: hypothetical protein ACREA0_02375 [bacterium]